MNVRCENCGQLALESDKVCWHCGRPLPGHDMEAPEKVAVNKGWQQTQSLGTIGGYVVVAVFIILAALVVTRVLGQQPLVSANVGERAPEGWEAFTDFRSRFTFYLPQAWTWFEPERRERRADPPFDYLMDNEQFFLLGTSPFGAETDDMALDFLAVPISDTAAFETEEVLIEAIITAEAFMVVGRSEGLNSLVYTETVQFLLNSENSDYRVLEVEQIEELDRQYLTVLVETPVETAEDFAFLRCKQQFFLGRFDSLLVTLCARDTVYTRYQRTFSEILTSFRRLE
jgi:hypothetical protein